MILKLIFVCLLTFVESRHVYGFRWSSSLFEWLPQLSQEFVHDPIMRFQTESETKHHRAELAGKISWLVSTCRSAMSSNICGPCVGEGSRPRARGTSPFFVRWFVLQFILMPPIFSTLVHPRFCNSKQFEYSFKQCFCHFGPSAIIMHPHRSFMYPNRATIRAFCKRFIDQ